MNELLELNRLLLVAANENHLRNVELFLHLGADINATNQYGDTTLTMASREGHTEIAKTLIDKGVDINIVNEGGWTALMFASLYKHAEIAKIIKQKQYKQRYSKQLLDNDMEWDVL